MFVKFEVSSFYCLLGRDCKVKQSNKNFAFDALVRTAAAPMMHLEKPLLSIADPLTNEYDSNMNSMHKP